MTEDKGQNQKGKSDTALKEEATLVFWKENKIFEKSLAKPAPKGEFVFYDGPPFATGLPHHGHLLGSTSKDLFGRYKTMRGYHVRRRWGWDCHGLPIETLVEKKLDIKNKKEILALGIEKFNEEARSLVLEYVQGWKRYVERLGRWVDFDNSYKTMDASYIESVWWALKQIYAQGNLYEGRKVLMYCPKDETPLAKAEIAMDNTYKDVTEEAVTVKFKIIGLDEYILAWTTTPWTLPGNVALAVGPDIDYVRVTTDRGVLWFAKERLESLASGAQVTKTVKGSELVGLEYEPLYEVKKVKAHKGKKWVVLPADFVSTEEGTGIVHTAVMYGEDDYALGKKEGLPMVPILTPGAVYNADAPELVRGKYIKKAEVDIKDDLEKRGLLFKREMYTHSYPHCHRCGTPLIYNAVDSWFINIQAVKAKMLAENEKVNWFPEHLKHGRFGNTVESAPDWTISRNRFWASPLPIWKDKDGNVTVVGSLDELKSLTRKSGNTYYVMRHGQSDNNVSPHTISSNPKNEHPLTELGKSQAHEVGKQLKDKGIDLIVTSSFVRTRQSAEIVRAEIGLDPSQVLVEERIREANLGMYEGRTYKDYEAEVPYTEENFVKAPEGGESFAGIKRRVGDFLYELERTYTGKKIVVVTHGYPAWLLHAVRDGASVRDTLALLKSVNLKNGEVRELSFVPLPHNADYELDYHLPYIDEVQLEKDGVPLKRVPEVVDSWVEAGAMPFAEYHYPFENKEEFEKRTPGDFVSEYIAQTRTWFYYLHALGVILFNHRAFTNVVSTGTLLASNGEKLSKSKQNYTDPYQIFDLYGADAERFYLMSSVTMLAEDSLFRDDELREAHGRVVNILRNTLSFYQLYKDERVPQKVEPEHVLDRWILSRMNQLIVEVTKAFDGFDTVHAARPIRVFIEDFSTWYVRRSRERVKPARLNGLSRSGGGDDEKDKQGALNTMHIVFRDVSKLIAPVMPFIAEEIYQVIKSAKDPESVHLSDWPDPWPVEEEILTIMAEVRRVVTFALEARQSAGVKVRQPLGELRVKSSALKGKPDLLDLIGEEVNVKKIIHDEGIEGDVALNTTLTDALRDEGEFRDLVREVQDLRKGAGLNPKDQAVLLVPEERKSLVEKHWSALAKATGLKSKEVGPTFEVRKV